MFIWFSILLGFSPTKTIQLLGYPATPNGKSHGTPGTSPASPASPASPELPASPGGPCSAPAFPKKTGGTLERGNFGEFFLGEWLMIVWLVVWTPLKKYESQLGWLETQYIWENKKCSKPPTSYTIWPQFGWLYGWLWYIMVHHCPLYMFKLNYTVHEST